VDEQDKRVRALARDALSGFEAKTRRAESIKGEEMYYVLVDAAPEWVRVLVREADALGDDYRYEYITDALESLADATDDADLDDLSQYIEPNPYQGDLLRWLGSDPARIQYVDDALAEGEHGESIMDDIGAGQVAEKREIFDSVLQSLRARAKSEPKNE